MSDLPPLPEGFQLRQAGPNTGDASPIPAPPPGFQVRYPQAPEKSAGQQLVEGFANVAGGMVEQLGAARQGTAPMVRNDLGESIRPVLGVLEETPDGFFISQGNKQYPVDPNQHVVMRDPQDGLMKVFQRTEDTDESIAAFGRILGLGAISQAPTRLLNAAQGPTQAARLTQDFQGAGVNPTIAATNQGRVPAMVQQAAANNPVTAGPVSRATQESLEQTAAAAETVAGKYGSARTPFEAGKALRQGADTFKSQFRDKADTLYNNLFMRFSPESAVPVPKTMDALSAPGSRFDNIELGKRFVDPRLAEWSDVIRGANGQVSLNDLRAFRSEIGQMLSRPAIVSDIDRAQLERVYAALSEDMMSTARIMGPQAVRALERADRFYKSGLKRINGALKELLKADGTEEGAYQLLTKVGAERGAKASASRIQAIKRSMPAEEWGDVASTVITELGKPLPSARTAGDGVDFSVSTFMTNYEKLSDAAKDALFSGPGKGGLKKEMDRLVRVASSQKQVERLANTSNTAMNVTSGGLGAGLVAFPIETVTTALVGNAGARLMMNPRFVGWLNSTPKQQTQAQWSRHLMSLNQLGRQNPELQEGISALLRQLPANAVRAEDEQE